MPHTWMTTPATFSPDRAFRYTLRRDVNPALGTGTVAFIMLNPSTADEHYDDPTIRRVISFAALWGYASVVVCNLSPYRATSPADLIAAGPEPSAVWERNLAVIKEVAGSADGLIAAWGTHGDLEARDRAVMAHLTEYQLLALGRTRYGFPKHPLYVRLKTPLVEFKRAGATTPN